MANCWWNFYQVSLDPHQSLRKGRRVTGSLHNSLLEWETRFITAVTDGKRIVNIINAEQKFSFFLNTISRMKIFVFPLNLYWTCYKGCIWQDFHICVIDVLVPNRPYAFTWTFADKDLRHLMASHTTMSYFRAWLGMICMLFVVCTL